MKKYAVATYRGLALSIAAFLFAATLVSANDTKTVKVILLGGQSNMVGQGKASDLTSPYSDPLPQIKIWQAKTKQWVALSPSRLFGPEISFGHALATAFPDENIRLVKYAAGGTSLYKDWAPTDGPQYVAFMAVMRAALTDLEANKVNYEITGMLWLQGESDAKGNRGNDYEKNLSAFITHMRTEFKTPEMPFIIAKVRDFYGKGVQAEMVRAAQESLAKTMNNVACFDTDDCGKLINGGHYASAGLIEIGKRFAEKYKEITSKAMKHK